jgi:predicted AAA+ superfamily ATPase
LKKCKIFFLRLQALSGIDLYEHESVIIFDEVQLFPKARQAIKHLVKDGRYHYIETGSLISIKKRAVLLGSFLHIHPSFFHKPLSFPPYNVIMNPMKKTKKRRKP